MHPASAANTVTLDKMALCLFVAKGVADATGGWALRPGVIDPRAWTIDLLSDLGERSSSVKGFAGAARIRSLYEWNRTCAYRPRTHLGRRLLEIRNRIVASGAAPALLGGN